LARNYAAVEASPKGGRSLPGYKLWQITDWIVANVAADLDLDQFAAQSGLSKFHFHRLFKRALGVSPAHYQLNLRMHEARRLLRETNKSVLDVALDVGYTNPSHFAKIFRRETGLAPSDYRRQR
jgi:AraC family transcriptional regulator